ncbi:uncharacterized protein B0T15DRAFT_401992 [Chaetomium strumarium]|uniref:Large ribosomal subunit protein mL50 n=1 Tax=Chaetomium strumarium TaxID=1170767 RepID=A0AAJ0LZC6_9PEZI|nr:hypothetical protein B0T15DRAFT_401992 [Chaetomium strumarium]
MRRLPRLRNAAPAGFVTSSTPTGSLRVPTAAAIATTSPLSLAARHNLNSCNAPVRPSQRRFLSDTPSRPSQPQTTSPPADASTAASREELEFLDDEHYPPAPAEIPTQLVYPRGVTTVPPPSDISDPAYKPAETADGLEEVGGLADWWDDPLHWGSEGGVRQFVASVATPFGPAEKVTDPAMLEVLARRAIIEAIVVARFAGAGKRKAVDRLFAHVDGNERLDQLLKAQIVVDKTGAATLKNADAVRLWVMLKTAVKNATHRRKEQQQQPAGDGISGTKEEAEALTADARESGAQEGEATEAKEAFPSAPLTPEVAQQYIESWNRNKGWRKAELRDPVVKFFAAKRIQQLTGHRLHDGKLCALHTVDSLLKQLVEPPKPKKLVELVESKGVFKDLPNVRVFPRRVTPIDKEKMVGRWKIIVKELEKRELPVIGTGDYGEPIEKKWVEGRTSVKLTAVSLGLASWRLPLGDSGALEFLLSRVPTADRQHPLNKQALRLVGNACADCDENRARVLESGVLRSFIMECMKEDALLPFAIAAALNLCVDYKLGQEKASAAGLSEVLVGIVSGERLLSCQSSLSHIMGILQLICNQDSEARMANPQTPALLLDLATSGRYDVDLDTFMEICTPALAYLTLEEFQSAAVANRNIELLQAAFHQLYTRFDLGDLDSDTASQLKQTLVDWLGSAPAVSHLQTAACLALGNLSRSDESSTALLPHVQEHLVRILTQAIPPTSSPPPITKAPAPPLQLVHATLSFLKNLAIPQANKPLLGDALLDPSRPLLPRLWASTRTQPQLQFTAVSLTRLLLANCSPNVRHACTPLPSDSEEPSNLALLTSVASSADEEPIRTEAARAVVQVCRALHPSPAATSDILDKSWAWPSPPPSPSASNEKGTEQDETLARFYKAHAHAITTSLHQLLTQKRFPTLRSDAIFCLALMSRSSREGAHVALQVLQCRRQPGSSAWQAVAEAITGSSDGDGPLASALFTPGADGEEGRRDTKELNNKVEQQQQQQQEEEEEEEEEDVGVSVQKLSLEPQLVDQQAQTKQPAARMARMDRENGMVLVAELLRSCPDALSELRKPLEAVLNKGGELLVRDREEEQNKLKQLLA